MSGRRFGREVGIGVVSGIAVAALTAIGSWLFNWTVSSPVVVFQVIWFSSAVAIGVALFWLVISVSEALLERFLPDTFWGLLLAFVYAIAVLALSMVAGIYLGLMLAYAISPL